MNTFDALQEVFVETFLETHPQTASYIGLTTYDTEMPSGTLNNRKKEIDQNKHFLKQFEDSSELLDFV